MIGWVGRWIEALSDGWRQEYRKTCTQNGSRLRFWGLGFKGWGVGVWRFQVKAKRRQGKCIMERSARLLSMRGVRRACAFSMLLLTTSSKRNLLIVSTHKHFEGLIIAKQFDGRIIAMPIDGQIKPSSLTDKSKPSSLTDKSKPSSLTDSS
eukprot:206737-Chlamydomonas_euryale.AAC.1